MKEIPDIRYTQTVPLKTGRKDWFISMFERNQIEHVNNDKK